MGRSRLYILVILVILAGVEYWYVYRPHTPPPPLPPASVPAVTPGAP
jgi:hypothetical protein